MKSIRSIAIALLLVLVAGACQSSGGDAAVIASSGDVDVDGTSAVESPADASADAALDDDEEPQNDTEADEDSETEDDDAPPADESESNDVDTAGSALLARVSDATMDASTARFEARLSVAGGPGSDATDFELTMSGAYDLDLGASDIVVDLSGIVPLIAAEATAQEAEMFGAMFAEPVQLRTIGETAWIRWGVLGQMFGAVLDDGSTAWLETAVEDAASMTGQFGVDSPESPTDLLQVLTDLDASVTEVGRESVRGVETTHYRIVIDLETAAESLPDEERAELEAELPGGITGELPVEVWMDDNDLLRRLLVDLDADSMGFEADADDFGSASLEFEIFDVGEPVAIEAPPADEVVSADELGFGFGGDL